ITAFPFCGEFPLCLPHDWNCYLVETERSAVVFAADSALQQEQVDFLSARLRGTERRTIVFSRGPTRTNRALPGYRDEPSPLVSGLGLWAWFLPLREAFSPSPPVGISHKDLAALAKEAGLRHYFPYALGSTPWFRIKDKDNFFFPFPHTTSMQRQELLTIE